MRVELNELVDNSKIGVSLVLDDQSTPWIGTQNGLYHYTTNGQLDHYTTTDGLSGNQVYKVAFGNGKIYASTGAGRIDIFDGISFNTIDAQMNWESGHKIAFDGQGNLWVGGTTNSGFVAFKKYSQVDGWQTSLPLDFCGDKWGFGYPISDFKIDGLNRVWISTRWGLLKYPDLNSVLTAKPEVYNTFDGLPANDVYKILKDDAGNLYFPTDMNGVSVFNGKSWKWLMTTLPFESSVWMQNTTAAYVSKNGVLWLGGAGGINRSTDQGQTWKSYLSYIYGNQSNYSNPDIYLSRLKTINFYTITEDTSGKIWTAGAGWQADSLGINVFDGTNWTFIQQKDGLKSGSVNQLLGDKNGNIWVGYFDKLDITRISPNGAMTHYADIGRPFQFLEDSNGRIWVGTDYGIKVFDNGSWTEFNADNGLLSNRIMDYTRRGCTPMVMDGLGNVWISYNPQLGLGVSMYDGTEWQHFNKERGGLPSDQINSLQVLVTSSGSFGGRTTGTGGSLFMGTPSEGVGNIDIDGMLSVTAVTGLKKESTGKLQVYPNPVNSQITLLLSGAKGNNFISIHDITGRNWYHGDHSGSESVQISVSNLKPGVYIAQWKNELGVHRKKFIKQ